MLKHVILGKEVTLWVSMSYLALVPLIQKGTLGDEIHPTVLVVGHSLCHSPGYARLMQILGEWHVQNILWSAHSCAIIWCPIHCYICCLIM